jgi:hypothetical protein
MNDITLRNGALDLKWQCNWLRNVPPMGFPNSDDVISRQDLRPLLPSFSSAAGLDIKTVNERPS